MGKAARKSQNKQQKSKKLSPSYASIGNSNQKKGFDEQEFINQEISSSDLFFRETFSKIAVGSSSSKLELHGLRSSNLTASESPSQGPELESGSASSKIKIHGLRSGSDESRKPDLEVRNLVLEEKNSIADSFDSLTDEFDSDVRNDFHHISMVEHVLIDESSKSEDFKGEPEGRSNTRLRVKVGETCGSDARKSVENPGCSKFDALQAEVKLDYSFGSSVAGGSSKGHSCDKPICDEVANQSKGQNSMQRKSKMVIRPSLRAIASGEERWKGSLVGYFLGNGIPFALVKQWAVKLWGSKSSVDVFIYGKDFFVFKFGNEEVRDHILNSGPIFFAGKWIILKLWQPHMSLCKAELESVPIWIKLYKVPLLYWTKEGLEDIVNGLGKLLHLDESSIKGDKLGYARACMEISTTTEIPSRFDVELPYGGLQEVHVEVPWKPVKCRICKVFGHSTDACFKGGNNVDKKFIKSWRPKAVEKTKDLEGVSGKGKESIVNAEDNYPPLSVNSSGKKIDYSKVIGKSNVVKQAADQSSSSIVGDNVKGRNIKSFLDLVKASNAVKHHQICMPAKRALHAGNYGLCPNPKSDPPDKDKG